MSAARKRSLATKRQARYRERLDEDEAVVPVPIPKYSKSLNVMADLGWIDPSALPDSPKDRAVVGRALGERLAEMFAAIRRLRDASTD